MSATLTSTVKARFLMAGDTVRIGAHMRIRVTDVDSNFGDGYVRITGADVYDQEWVEMYAKDTMVELVDTDAEDAEFAALMRALSGIR